MPSFVKILGNPSGFPAFLPCITPNSLPIKFCDPKRARFRAEFCAEDESGLTPGKDDKRKNAENTPFGAGSDYRAMLNRKSRKTIKTICFTAFPRRADFAVNISPKTGGLTTPTKNENNESTGFSFSFMRISLEKPTRVDYNKEAA